ncbi:uncharacterized protein METZ01_LOCUS375940, partial [marine metagenome]
LYDRTGPRLIYSQALLDTVHTIITNNEWPQSSGIKYFNTITPTLTLKTSDATSDSIKLWCKIDNVLANISKDDGTTQSDTLILKNLEATPIKIMTGLTDPYPEPFERLNNIRFYVQDKLANAGADTGAALHDSIRLDMEAAVFDISNPWHGSIPEIDNEYVVVVFKEPVFGNQLVGSPVFASDFSLTFDQNSGTATAATITGIANNTNGTAVAAGDSVIRVILNISGDPPDGLERIKISPRNGDSVFDRAGNATAANVETDWIALKDQTAPAGIIVTDIAGNGPIDGWKYVTTINPELTI